MPVQPLVNRLQIAATVTAPKLSRLFVEHALHSWTVPEGIVDDAKVIASEFVTNSVQFTGYAHSHPTHADLENLAMLGVQVRIHGRSLFIEVWDSGQPSPYSLPLRDEGESGRGPGIVEDLSRNVGQLWLDGQIMWAELDVEDDLTVISQFPPRLMTSADMALTSRLIHGSSSPRWLRAQRRIAVNEERPTGQSQTSWRHGRRCCPIGRP